MRVELASDRWVSLAAAYLERHVDALPDDTRFSLCEVFRDPPAHLDDGGGVTAWWLSIGGGRVEVGRGDRSDLAERVEIPYSDALPLARLVYDLNDPDVVAMLRRRAEDRREAGAQSVSRQLAEVLRGLHNYLAVRTA